MLCRETRDERLRRNLLCVFVWAMGVSGPPSSSLLRRRAAAAAAVVGLVRTPRDAKSSRGPRPPTQPQRARRRFNSPTGPCWIVCDWHARTGGECDILARRVSKPTALPLPLLACALSHLHLGRPPAPDLLLGLKGGKKGSSTGETIPRGRVGGRNAGRRRAPASVVPAIQYLGNPLVRRCCRRPSPPFLSNPTTPTRASHWPSPPFPPPLHTFGLC